MDHLTNPALNRKYFSRQEEERPPMAPSHYIETRDLVRWAAVGLLLMGSGAGFLSGPAIWERVIGGLLLPLGFAILLRALWIVQRRSQ